MSTRTIFLSRLLGLYFLIVAISMLAHKESTVATVVAMVHNAPLLFLLGIIIVAAGLAMVLAHNIWSGGALPITITILGWLALLKGLFFLFLTPAAADFYLVTLHYAQYFYFYASFTLVLGAYLTCSGFASISRIAKS
jgi:hypothetical protein